jgi:ABC-type proline/glycine betaine transport system substrate-binding protein
MENFMKISFLRTMIVTVVSAIVLSISAMQLSAGTRLNAIVPDWMGGEITCEVAMLILEQELDYKVNRVEFPSGNGAWEATGAGDFDMMCEHWPSYTEGDTTYIAELGGDGSVISLGASGIVGLSDYYVPKYWADANPGFKTWEDLNNYKAEFATIESGGKGRLIGCPIPGWNCYDQVRLDMLGIDFVADELGSEAAALAEAQGAYKRQEAFLVYLWEPHWAMGAMDLVPVKLPANKPCDTWTEEKGYKDCGLGYWPATGWSEDITFNSGRPAFWNDPENAKAKAMMGNMNLGNSHQSAMLAEVNSSGRSVQDVVQEWKDSHKEVWMAWLN